LLAPSISIDHHSLYLPDNLFLHFI